jgi:hypothetical protein
VVKTRQALFLGEQGNHCCHPSSKEWWLPGGQCRLPAKDCLSEILRTQELLNCSVITPDDVHIPNWSFVDPAVVGCYESECLGPFPRTHIVQLFLVHNPGHCRDAKMVTQGSNCRSWGM